MTQKWTFHDPAGKLADYTFAINPTGDSPVYQKTMQFTTTTAPGGNTVLFEGADQVPVFSVTGTILTETQYQAFTNYFHLRHQFLLTDDLGRQRYIYITEFQPVRVQSAIYPWKHTYTLSGYVLSETLPTPNDPPIG